MKHSRFLYKYLCYCTLGLTTMLCAAAVHGADSQRELPSNHWRQLWPQSAYEAWTNKPEAELQRLAKAGQPAAQFMLWQNWRRTHKEQAQAYLQAAAQAGLPQAVWEQGYTLFLDRASSRAAKLEGWKMMEQAAAAGYPGAQSQVAEYDAQFMTIGTPEGQLPLLQPNLERALDYFRNCARLNHPSSMRHLALLYSSGIGEPQDEAESPHNLLLRAARNGDVEAMTHLSDRYLLGHGETADALQAARWRCFAWLRTPSRDSFFVDEKAEPKAQPTPARDELAQLLSLFVKTAEQHDSKAAMALARCYVQHGQPGEAVALLRVAKDWGSPAVADELSKLEPSLPPEQTARAGDKTLFPFAQLIQSRGW